ncbi:MAG: hypothetical protein IT336_15080 [Thermomicrobiales bacterium]|nr:hypothetical protein [Thermomicrobiales bacterium]
MLAAVDRAKFYRSLRSILGLRRWKQSQVDGLDAFLDECQRDPLIPDGVVGIQRVAYWIYTMVVETASTFQPIKEYGGRAYFVRRYGAKTRKGRDLGNDTDKEAVAYAGAGLVQTTGENNVERLEAHIREHYPHIVQAVESETGRSFDLTIGDQPDDRDDVRNMLRFDVAYVALVAGTTFAFYGPPLSRYISAKRCDYKGARRCVNGTDRDDEFAAFCPKIEAALRAAIAPETEPAATAVVPAVTPSVEPAAVATGHQTETSPTPENAVTTGAVNVVAAVSTEPPAPVEGGSVNDAPKSVTNGSGSWIRSVLAWIGGLFTAASEHVERAFGLSPDVQKYLIVAVAGFGAVYLVLKGIAEWQVRRIASDPAKVNVK